MQPGTLIAGKYRLSHRLGQGAMGVVWAAVHELTERQVALKLIPNRVMESEEVRRRLLREARACGRLSHRNVIEIYDVGQTDEGEPFLVMQLLTGETLSELLKRERKLAPPFAAYIALEIARGLSAAHAAGIIHRDLKPPNVYLHQQPDGDGLMIKVLDFGVSKIPDLQDGSKTETGSAIGSPAYMSPEQAKGDRYVDHRTDIWALGVVLFELLTGRRPFLGETMYTVVAEILTGTIPLVSDLAPEVEPGLVSIVAGCIERDLDRRIATAEDVITLLRPYAGVLPVPSQPRPYERLPTGTYAWAPANANDRGAGAPSLPGPPPPSLPGPPPPSLPGSRPMPTDPRQTPGPITPHAKPIPPRRAPSAPQLPLPPPATPAQSLAMAATVLQSRIDPQSIPIPPRKAELLPAAASPAVHLADDVALVDTATTEVKLARPTAPARSSDALVTLASAPPGTATNAHGPDVSPPSDLASPGGSVLLPTPPQLDAPPRHTPDIAVPPSPLSTTSPTTSQLPAPAVAVSAPPALPEGGHSESMVSFTPGRKRNVVIAISVFAAALVAIVIVVNIKGSASEAGAGKAAQLEGIAPRQNAIAAAARTAATRSLAASSVPLPPQPSPTATPEAALAKTSTEKPESTDKQKTDKQKTDKQKTDKPSTDKSPTDKPKSDKPPSEKPPIDKPSPDLPSPDPDKPVVPKKPPSPSPTSL